MAILLLRDRIAAILCISILHFYGIYLFGEGFLLTKFMLNNTSCCNSNLDGEHYDLHIDPDKLSSCWHPPTFSKAIIIVIDALRFDFTVPFETINSSIPALYHNRLTILHETAQSQPAHCLLTPFIADPPTTTLQRIKGLTTGSLPTFIEAGSNFAGLAIEEDNLISQLVGAGKVVVQLGDDTWQSLFPGFFHPNLSRPFESFNIRDLHSVDDGIMEHLPQLLVLNDTSWDVIISHFLGVDHAGHRFGPNHPAMSAKLLQMNDIIRDLMAQVHEDTLLVVMGDHGMDSHGNHGGESEDEVTAALWLYSRKAVFGRVNSNEMEITSNSIRQIDIVPTLSILLGIPIPFNNLGSLIQEAFLGPSSSEWKNLALASHKNSLQIKRYYRTYSEMRNIGRYSKQHQLELQITEVPEDGDIEGWHKFYLINRRYQRETLEIFHRLWASFNYHSMILGVLVSIAAMLLLIMWIGAEIDKRTINIRLIPAAIIGPFMWLVQRALPIFETFYFGITYCACLAVVLVSSIWTSQALAKSISSHLPSAMMILSLFVLAQAVGFASNSYTIHEDSVVSLYLTTFGFLSFITSMRLQPPRERSFGYIYSVLFAVLTRISTASRLCREEQASHCHTTFYVPSASLSVLLQLCIPYIICLVLPELIVQTYVPMTMFSSSTKAWIRRHLRLGLVLVALYSTADAIDNGEWYKGFVSSNVVENIKFLLARAALIHAIGSAPWLHLRTRLATKAIPSYTTSITNNKTTFVVDSDKLIYPQKSEWYTLYFLSIFLVIAILLPPMGQFSLAICLFQIFILKPMVSANASTIQPLNAAIMSIVLAMLGSHHFFHTGHQAVLASIQWSCAYVFFRSIHQPWTTIMLLLNSFGAQILCALALPLLIEDPIIADPKQPRQASSSSSTYPKDSLHLGILIHTLYYSLMQLATTLWAAILRRHLMLYRVFMPRYLMATILLVVIDIILAVIFVVQ